MNKIKKLIAIMSIFFIATNSALASSIDAIIKKSEIDKTSTIAVSVKDVKTGRTVYQYNEQKLMNPASAQKIFTMKAAYNELGKDYTYKTAAYMDNNNNLYIKLSGDPSLTTESLKNLFEEVNAKYKKQIKDIIIDPSIIDNKQWGIGWMWDDDTNTYLPKYSPFSINENKIDIVIEPGKNGKMPYISNKSNYSMMLVNLLKNGNENAIFFERNPWQSADMTYVKGTIKTTVKYQLPVNSTERYFKTELSKAISSSKLKYTGAIKVAPIPQNAKKIAEINSKNLSEIVGYTLKNSNNFYSEMIFKTAAASYTKKQGSTEDAIKMFNKYYADVKANSPTIVDACGISRNDIISADWMTTALNKIYKDKDFDDFVTLLPKPMEGTLSDRLLDISLKVRAKTGTASGISSIAGYIDTKSGKKYSFSIMIQNFDKPVIDIKKFEDNIIREIYNL